MGLGLWQMKKNNWSYDNNYLYEIVPTNWTFAEKDSSWMNALLVQMEDLVLIDEKRIMARENIDYI
jgi:hypothetical protein